MSSPAPASSRRGISFTAAVKLGFALGIGMAVTLAIVGVAMTILVDAVLGAQPHVARSPDGTRRVVITERTGWFGGTDPPVVVFVVLESTAGEVIDQVSVGVDEDSDVGTPSVRWEGSSAVVTGLERAHDVTVTVGSTETRQ